MLSALTKLLISRKASLNFAEEHVVRREENCSKVHFSDESKINLFGSDGKHFAIFMQDNTPVTLQNK